MMATAFDIMGTIGFIMECAVIDRTSTVGWSTFYNMQDLVNRLMYKLGGWAVANEEPWQTENVGGSDLSLFQEG